MKKILIAVMVILSSCGSNQERVEHNEDFETAIPGKLHGTYIVSEMKNENVGGEDIFFRFDSIKSEVTGNAGCNRFNSVYRHLESTITFQPAVSTKMYCEGKMEREKEVIEILSETSEIIRQDEAVLLLSKESELLLKLKKTDRSE